MLLQLKADAEIKQHEQIANKLVEQMSLQVYSVFLTNPTEALTAVMKRWRRCPDSRAVRAEGESRRASQQGGSKSKVCVSEAGTDVDGSKQFQEAVILEGAEMSAVKAPILPPC